MPIIVGYNWYIGTIGHQAHFLPAAVYFLLLLLSPSYLIGNWFRENPASPTRFCIPPVAYETSYFLAAKDPS